MWDAHGITGRCDIIVGDFFSIGAAGCCHVMKHIIHDWEDDKATRILRNSRAAMNGDGKLLVVAMVVPEGDAPSPSKFLDLEMLLSLHSHERTQKEYAALFASADFKLNRVVPTASRDSSDEGVRV
jgi:hypothetical protein